MEISRPSSPPPSTSDLQTEDNTPRLLRPRRTSQSQTFKAFEKNQEK